MRLSNRTGERVLVVLSVDGVNAISGQTADASQGGYVLDPWESAEINGWRKSLDDVAQFVFTDLPDSYAARTGRPDNVGVIGIAVFREARPIAYAPPAVPPPWMEDSRGDQAPQAKSAAPAAESSAADAYGGVARQRIGTGHGAREWSPVGQTQFERASSHPAQVTQVRYDDVATLAALGILPRTPWYMPSRDVPRPKRFPAASCPIRRTADRNRPSQRFATHQSAQKERAGCPPRPACVLADASFVKPVRSALRVLAILSFFFDLLARLFDVLARAGDGIAGRQEAGREHRQHRQQNQTLHRILLLSWVEPWSRRWPAGASNAASREKNVESNDFR